MADASTPEILASFIARHGPLVGQASVVNPTTRGPKVVAGVEVPGETADNPTQDPFYRYTFADGSTLEINKAGQIKDASEKTPKAPTDTNVQTLPIGGQTYQRDPKTGQWTPINVPGNQPKPDRPPEPTVNTTAPQIPVWDAAAGKWGWGPNPNYKQTDKPVRTEIHGDNLINLDTGQVIATLPSTKPATPKEGDTRPNVKDGYAIQEKYVGGQWVVDPSVPPTPYSPDTQGKAKEGDTRPNVVDGYTVQQVYKGGQWVVDPSVPPKPFVPEKPTTLTTGKDSQYIVQQLPDGTTRQIDNPNYQPSDVAGRTQQLQARAQAKRDDLQKRLDAGDITPERAQQEFDAFWNAQIEPAKQQLAAEQQRQQLKDQSDLEANQRAGITQEATYEQNRQSTARQAGRDAVSDALALLPYRVGPGYGKAVGAVLNSYSTGKMPDLSQIGADAFTFQGPDLHAISEQATAQALAHLSPYAALKAGAPIPQVPQGVDVNAALNQTTYRPTVSVKPDGTVTVQHAPVAADPSPQAPSAPDPAALVQQAANAANSIAGIAGGGPDLIRGGDPSQDPNAYLRQLAGYS